MHRVRTASSACTIFALLFVLGSFSDTIDMKKGTVWITRQSAYAQEVAKDNESNQTPFVGVNMRGYYTNVPQERDFKVPIPPDYYEQSFKTFSESGVDFVRYLFFFGNLMKEIRFLL